MDDVTSHETTQKEWNKPVGEAPPPAPTPATTPVAKAPAPPLVTPNKVFWGFPFAPQRIQFAALHRARQASQMIRMRLTRDLCRPQA